jgi:Rieske Fe-S protein
VSTPIAPLSAVPVGGGVIVAERGVVVTQPVDGEVVAFRTLCPHRGCQVRAVAAGTINCFCHGSRFRIADGAVVGGPATEPLTPVPVTVLDGMVVHAPG